MHNKSFPKTAVTIREPLCEKKTIFVFLKSLGYYAKQFISQNGGNINTCRCRREADACHLERGERYSGMIDGETDRCNS